MVFLGSLRFFDYQYLDGNADILASLGPLILTEDLIPGNTNGIPTVLDNLYRESAISTESIGIYFEPTTTGVIYCSNADCISLY
jgi:hypothetical protein